MRLLDPSQPHEILVRGTNWVGDAVMTLPALEALKRAAPQANISVLAKPWAAPVYAASPAADHVLLYDQEGQHHGGAGRLVLGRQLHQKHYQWAVLFQNAFEAALLARLAGARVRLGYATDGRRLLLSHPVPRDQAALKGHETSYYLNLLHAAGILADPPPPGGVPPRLVLPAESAAWAEGFLGEHGLAGKRLLGLAPGAAFGPAKRWPTERFAAVGRMFLERGEVDAALIFGSGGEAAVAAEAATGLESHPVLNLAGQTTLAAAMALLARLDLFITNDSGLMHAAAALGTPTVAVFGSTNPHATRPLGPHTAVVRETPDCAPCKQPECPEGHMHCFMAVDPDMVAAAGLRLLESAR